MGVIREYGAPRVANVGPINGPQYSADQFGAAQGRALMQAGETVQDVAGFAAKKIDQENTSDITAKVSKANADLAIDLQETIRTAEPGDKKVFEDYNKRVDDTFSEIGEGASTEGARAFYSEASARVKGQLFKTSAQGQAELAGVKAVTDYTSTINSLSSASFADPSARGLQSELHKKAIENLVAQGGLPRHKALELEQEGERKITVGAMRGWANLNPEYAREKLKSGEFDSILGAEGKLQMLGEIDQAVRGKEIDAERKIREQERVLKLNQQKTQNELLVNMVDNKLTTKDILQSNLDAFGSGSKEQFLNMLEKANSPESRLKTDGNTMVALFNRINLPDGDPNKLTDENDLNQYFGNGLSMPDLNRLRDEMQGTQTEAGRIENDLKKQVIEIAKGKLTKSNALTGIRDPIGDEQMQRFMVQFLDEYKEQRAKGVSSTELLNPDSPKYLGKNIANYVRTPQQIMRDMVPKKAPAQGLSATLSGQNPANAAPLPAITRKPGESPADYLKRKKAGGQ